MSVARQAPPASLSGIAAVVRRPLFGACRLFFSFNCTFSWHYGELHGVWVQCPLAEKYEGRKCGGVFFFHIPKVITHQWARTNEVSTRGKAEWFSCINQKNMDRSANHYRICGKHFISGKP